MIDLNKLHPATKSPIFKSLDELGKVLSFLYYLSFVKKVQMKPDCIEDCLLYFTKEKIINAISNSCNINTNKVEKIVNYLINKGSSSILEFPLFEHGESLITIPSLIMVNDWSFSIVNGHYIKIQFTKREKTISVSTETKLQSILENVTNVLYCKEEYYEFFDENNKKNKYLKKRLVTQIGA